MWITNDYQRHFKVPHISQLCYIQFKLHNTIFCCTDSSDYMKCNYKGVGKMNDYNIILLVNTNLSVNCTTKAL